MLTQTFTCHLPVDIYIYIDINTDKLKETRKKFLRAIVEKPIIQLNVSLADITGAKS